MYVCPQSYKTITLLDKLNKLKRLLHDATNVTLLITFFFLFKISHQNSERLAN